MADRCIRSGCISCPSSNGTLNCASLLTSRRGIENQKYNAVRLWNTAKAWHSRHAPAQLASATPQECVPTQHARQPLPDDTAAVLARDACGDPSLPASYRRLCAVSTGSSFREVAQVEEVPLLAPGPGEVLVRVSYAGVNGGCETFRARGEHAFAPNRERGHFLLGAEGAGTVAAIGPGVDTLQVGDAVTFGGGGAFGEYVPVPAPRCFRLAAGEQPSAQAAALALSGTVANTALQEVARIQAGETVLVTAAAGGTGHFAVQVAKLVGCRVVATCGGPAKADRLRSLGVDRVIDYRQEDVAAVLADELPAGIDVAYEGVGGRMFAAAMGALKAEGRVLVLGYISGYPHATDAAGGGRTDAMAAAEAAAEAERWRVPGLPPVEEIFWGGRAISRGGQVVYGQTLPEDRSSIARRRAEVFDWWREGRMQAWVDDTRTFEGLESVSDAIEHMLSGQTSGKVVVRIS